MTLNNKTFGFLRLYLDLVFSVAMKSLLRSVVFIQLHNKVTSTLCPESLGTCLQHPEYAYKVAGFTYIY